MVALGEKLDVVLARTGESKVCVYVCVYVYKLCILALGRNVKSFEQQFW